MSRKKDTQEAFDPLPDQDVTAIVSSDESLRLYAKRIYKFDAPPCKESDGCTKNCKENSNCLYGLGERRKGVWAKVPPKLKTLEEKSPEWHIRKEGEFCGLKNLGATCYMNSLLQTLFMNTNFRQGVFEWSSAQCGSGGQSSQDVAIIEHLQRLFANLQELRSNEYNPKPFTDALNIATGVQQDVQEFNKLLLQLLERRFAKSENESIRQLVQREFRGFYRYETQCLKCGTQSASSREKTSFYELNLSIQNLEDLEASLQSFLADEHLDGDNQYLCECCGCKQDARRAIKLEELPEVLNFQLMRFVYDTKTWQRKKLTDKFAFPEILDMSQFLAKRPEHSVSYKLTAVLIHLGAGATSGHYIAHIRDERTNKWYKFDDETVTDIQGEGFRVDPSNSKLEEASAATAKTVVIDEAQADLRAAIDVPKPKPARGRGRPRADKAGFTKKTAGTSRCSDKEKTPKHSKEKTCESTGAYMLVYTLENRRVHQSPVAPSHLVEEIVAHNLDLEKQIEEYRRSKSEVEAAIEKRKNEYQRLWSLAPVGTEDDACWVPTAWLRTWIAGEESVAQKIPLHELTCEHSPGGGGASLRRQRRAEQAVTSSIDAPAPPAPPLRGLGSDSEPIIVDEPASNQGASCVVEEGLPQSTALQSAPAAAEVVHSEISFPEGLYFLDPICAAVDAKRVNPVVWREWEACYKSDIPALNNASICPKCISQRIDDMRSVTGLGALRMQLQEALGVSHTASEPGYLIPAKYFRALKTARNPKIPADMNEGLFCLCERKGFRESLRQATATVTMEAWSLIKKIYPLTSEFFWQVPGCLTCSECEQRTSGELDTRREMRAIERSFVDPLFRAVSAGKVVPLRLEDMKAGDEREFRVLPTSWLRVWAVYIQNAQADEPAPLTIDGLLCEHGQLMYDLNWTKKYGDPFQLQEVLKDGLQFVPVKQWEYLAERHPGLAGANEIKVQVQCLQAVTGKPAGRKRALPASAPSPTKSRRASTRATTMSSAISAVNPQSAPGPSFQLEHEGPKEEVETQFSDQPAKNAPFAVRQHPSCCLDCVAKRERKEKDDALSYFDKEMLVKPVYPGSSLDDELRKTNDLLGDASGSASTTGGNGVMLASRPRRQHGRVKVPGVSSFETVEEFRQKIAQALPEWRDPRRMKLYRESGIEVPCGDGVTLKETEILPPEVLYVVIDAFEAPSSGGGHQELEHGFKGSALVDLSSPTGDPGKSQQVKATWINSPTGFRPDLEPPCPIPLTEDNDESEGDDAKLAMKLELAMSSDDDVVDQVRNKDSLAAKEDPLHGGKKRKVNDDDSQSSEDETSEDYDPSEEQRSGRRRRGAGFSKGRRARGRGR